jgi:hypothetical protein
LVKGESSVGTQCVYSDDLLLTAAYQGTRIQGYCNTYEGAMPPMQTGYVRIEGDDITFDGFEVSGPSVSFYSEGGGHNAKLGSDNAENALLRHLYIHNIGEISYYCKAVYAYRGGHLTVQNVLEINLDVSRIKNGAHYLDPEITFVNCTFDRLGNDTYIGAFYRAGSNGCIGWVNNCIWTDCGATGFYYLCRTTNNPLYIDYTCTSDTPTLPDGGVYFWQCGPGTGCTTDDPLYVDPFADHRLQGNSPCVDTGDPSIQDYDGSPSDMGCYGGPYGDWFFED